MPELLPRLPQNDELCVTWNGRPNKPPVVLLLVRACYPSDRNETRINTDSICPDPWFCFGLGSVSCDLEMLMENSVNNQQLLSCVSKWKNCRNNE